MTCGDATRGKLDGMDVEPVGVAGSYDYSAAPEMGLVAPGVSAEVGVGYDYVSWSGTAALIECMAV